jgi:urease accessory protein UreF
MLQSDLSEMDEFVKTYIRERLAYRLSEHRAEKWSLCKKQWRRSGPAVIVNRRLRATTLNISCRSLKSDMGMAFASFMLYVMCKPANGYLLNNNPPNAIIHD